MANNVTDYNDLTDTIIDVLKTNNTLTATWPLATSVSAIDSNNITKRDLEIYAPGRVNHPYISVRLTAFESELEDFGGNDFNTIENITGEIICTAQNYKLGADDTELWKIMRNVQRVIREDNDLSGYNKNGFCVMYIRPTAGQLKTIPHGDDTAYVRAGVIEFEIRGLLR